MKVSELGEFGLINLLAKIAYRIRDKQSPAWQNLLIGIGDDAAAWRGDASTQLLTVDSFIQDEHFSLAMTSWQEAGWKALAVNLSDIAAMGGVPQYAVVSLTLPGDTEVDDMKALYQGMTELAQEFGVAIVGGDISRAPQVALNISVLGSTGNRNGTMLTRSGAKPGDRIAVTGYLGAASAGLEMLIEKLTFDDKTSARLKQAFLKPCPRVNEGRLFLEQGVKAAIDISDGLVSDLGHVCQASKLGARLEVSTVPVDPAVRTGFGDRALELALSGGEDYELLFTASAEIIDNVRKIAKCPITVIGDMIADKEHRVSLFDQKGNTFKLDRGGWEHFRQ
ncbi:MAG: thiamine-phosphate kinase [Dehalococcoidia bacterium]